MAANTTFVSGAILTAAQMNALPWGIVDATAGGTSGRGFVIRGAGDVTVTNTLADVTGLTVTFTPVTGRLYEASFAWWAQNGAVAQWMRARIADGSNNNKYTVIGTMTALSTGIVFAGSVVLTGLSGSTTLKMRAQMETATSGTIIANGTDGFATFMVKDIGPST